METGLNILCLCEGIHVASLGLCHKVSRLTWWNLGGSEWKLSGRNWYECLISVITCYYDDEIYSLEGNILVKLPILDQIIVK